MALFVRLVPSKQFDLESLDAGAQIQKLRGQRREGAAGQSRQLQSIFAVAE
jgi:hypothetical protein